MQEPSGAPERDACVFPSPVGPSALTSLIIDVFSSPSGSAVLPASKSFDPKVFLSTIHPNATFNDLNQGERASALFARHELYAD